MLEICSPESSQLDKQCKNATMTKLCLDHAVKPVTVLISILNNILSSAPLVSWERDTQILGK